MGILKKIIEQFISHPFKKYKGIKPAQTSAATMISDSKSLIRNVLELKRSERQLRKQIQDYKGKLNELRGIRGPGPGTEKHGEAKKYEEGYNSKRRYLVSLIALISNTITALSKRFDETIGTLSNITLDSQVVLFDLEEKLNKFLDSYLRKYRKLGKKRAFATALKDLADRINRIKADHLKSELRALWQASKAQKRRITSKYTIEEISFMGNVPILRKIKRHAIETGTLTLRISNLDPKMGMGIAENSRKLIRDNVLIQKDVKVLFNRLYHLLKRTKNDVGIFDEVNKKRFLGILNKSQRKYDSVMRDITSQSFRLYLDVRIRPVPMKVEQPKKIVKLSARRIKRRAV
ncbi:hypothetical protein KY331_00495 [Candidatus Woesearchaeota archaeon]|nr:hypothetical protein [Candidatus Woesearchaeota archaeon]